MTAEPAAAPVVITEPGVYEISNLDYHADPVPGGSLSSTGARKLLEPSCPALFQYERQHPPESTRAFDTGHAVHDAILGGGPEIVRVDADNWMTKSAKVQRDEIRARGAVPILAHEHDVVLAMVASVRAHPIAGRLFEPGTGQAEASLFWTDERTGVHRRARLDWLPEQTGRRLIIPDLKTCKSAQRDEFARSAMSYGYHQQGPYYLDGVTALELGERPVFVFVAVEKTPPYLVNVIQLDHTATAIGALLNRRAIDIYAECDRTGIWPGYSADVEIASLPAWYERRYEQDLQS
ncbi:PD-(D/E)XK nuclease-like domain-containing protein [uncultured Jatrophihabitans sp.]|uniref:PD-(D/E)XK nuclease-like domain-containing protein n=1 Tax=uncultured Jatrophihabitans sp. TaxID=1610747 RepID=UPI0035CBFA35